jgi:tRNA-specific 2-thiouridylase
LKFGKILEYADSVNADVVATGHYARIGRRQGRAILQRAVDRRKDQSYVLFGLQRSVLERVLFPLGGLTKEAVREEARRFGLPVSDKPDSVEICFVPDGDYASVVAARRPEAFRPGPVMDSTGKVVGEHRGIGHYTVGQRRGLGIAFGLPIYVTSVDADSNTVFVGTRDQLLKRGFIADQVNWLIEPPTRPVRVRAKIRYQHEPAPAIVECPAPQLIRVVFDEPQSAITPGQSVVLYDGDDCLGGGWIQRTLDIDDANVRS